MATTRLQLYQIAARAVGERSVDSLTETSETRRLLDEVWSQGNGAIRHWLEQGYWNFATRAIQIDPSSDVTPEFGYTNAFEKPADFVRLDMISADERFSYPLTDYEIEGNYIFADVDPLYLRFVSDDADWGGDFSKWPESFTAWAGHDLGYRALLSRLKNDTDDDRLMKKVKRLLVDARSKDAQQEPPRFSPPSSWEQSRYGRRGTERGKRGRLIG